MAKLNLSAPWVDYYDQVSALLGSDPLISVFLDEELYKLKIYVDDEIKASALDELLPNEKQWGEITLTIEVIPSNKEKVGLTFAHQGEFTDEELFAYVFAGNPLFKKNIHLEFPFDITYVVFKKQIVQYYNDNLSDPHGITSTLAQNIAKEIFETPAGVFYCTDLCDD